MAPSTPIWQEAVAALVLVASNVALHAIGTFANLRWILSSLKNQAPLSLARSWWFIIRMVMVLLALHSAEVAIWSEFYMWQHCFPDRDTAYYFSVVTYTTLGYGDLLLPRAWRLLGGWEAMTGVFMFGWSTATLVTFIHHVQGARMKKYFPEAAD